MKLLTKRQGILRDSGEYIATMRTSASEYRELLNVYEDSPDISIQLRQEIQRIKSKTFNTINEGVASLQRSEALFNLMMHEIEFLAEHVDNRHADKLATLRAVAEHWFPQAVADKWELVQAASLTSF